MARKPKEEYQCFTCDEHPVFTEKANIQPVEKQPDVRIASD
jgi:hypothetical protein